MIEGDEKAASFNNTDEMKQQYGTAQNLNRRILLHQRYSTNKLGWGNWVFQNYHLKAKQIILELGCGNAGIWRANSGKIPDGTKLVLSDFSVGMLDAAKANTGELGFAEYQVIDAQEIPYSDDTFDIVIANHMLYHKSVEALSYEDSLHITEAKPLVDYILSSQGIGNINEIIVGENVARFTEYIDEIFARKSYVDVRKAAGIFVSTGPLK